MKTVSVDGDILIVGNGKLEPDDPLSIKRVQGELEEATNQRAKKYTFILSGFVDVVVERCSKMSFYLRRSHAGQMMINLLLVANHLTEAFGSQRDMGT